MCPDHMLSCLWFHRKGIEDDGPQLHSPFERMIASGLLESKVSMLMWDFLIGYSMWSASVKYEYAEFELVTLRKNI